MRFGVLSTMALAVLGSWTTVGRGDDIVETAVKAGQFKTLAAALTSAELVKTCKGQARSPCLHRPTKRSPNSPKKP